MARKTAQETPPPAEEPRGRSWTWLWITLAAGTFVLAVALLHVVGALRGPEEALYASLKNVPVVGFLVSPLHKESWEGRLTPEQIIDVKDLRKELIRTQNQVSELSGLKKDIKKLESGLGRVSGAMEAVQKDVADIKEGVYAPAPGAESAAAPAAPGAAAAPAIAMPAGPQAAAAFPATENYRAVSKIFEKISAETVVDIFNNLSDEERVEILASMK
ncbi:MAG: hypothetical protein AB1742_02780, partial [bacterium]